MRGVHTCARHTVCAPPAWVATGNGFLPVCNLHSTGNVEVGVWAWEDCNGGWLSLICYGCSSSSHTQGTHRPAVEEGKHRVLGH